MACSIEEIKECVVDALMLEREASEIGDDDDLRETLGVDSVGFLEIYSALEDRFGVEILGRNSSQATARTPRDLATLINGTATGSERD